MLKEIFNSQVAPRITYHYTSQAGLLGIFSSRTIWASAIQYLNDASEFAFARGVVGNAVSELEVLSKHQRAVVEIAMRRFTEGGIVHHCATSFSEEPDLLSQWRAYCPATGGYSIGFTSDAKLSHGWQPFSLRLLSTRPSRPYQHRLPEGIR
jgi:hypothetical protein